jgi:two-component system nitrate/nitrite sensor histidine kinase NarX
MDVRDPDRWRAAQDAPAGLPVTASDAAPAEVQPAPADLPEAGAGLAPLPAVPTASGVGDGLAPILESFLIGVVRLVDARAGVIRSLSPERGEMRVVAMAGLPDAVRRREAVAGSCGVCADAMRCADVRVAADVASCGEIGSEGIFGGEGRGAVAVPLDYKGRTVGVFTLFFDGVSHLRADVIHLLRPIGQLLGVTLENAKLEHDKLRASVIQERQTMAGEIHDSLAQSLTFARMRMPLLQDAIAEKDTARGLKYFRDVYDELGHANRRLRALITHFRAGMDAQGLLHALEETTVGFFERTGIALTFESRAPELRLPVDVEVQVFHVIQEALANVQRHSRARRATVVTDRIDGHAVFTVEDDGIGWAEAMKGAPQALAGPQRTGAAAARAGHFGLEIMHERAKAAGGRLEFERGEQGGARVRLLVPLADAA